jgi:hypothetical protein
LLVVAAPGSLGQTTSSGDAFQNQFPDPLQYKAPVPELPELQFAVVTEIDLAGPFVSGPRVVGDHVEVRTTAGLMRVDWTGEVTPVRVDPAEAGTAVEEPSGWGLSPDGSHRGGQLNGRLVVQKICEGCRNGWNRRWRLRVPGLAPVAPLLTSQRVYFGSADNRVYGVRRRNGHRLWATPMNGRVLRELALWIDPDTTTQPGVAAILVVPDPGAEMVVLDVYSGAPMLRYRLAGEGDQIVGAPAITPDGHVILARQGYAADDAGIIVLKLVQAEPDPAAGAESEPAGYNPPTSDEAAPGEPASDQRAVPPAPGAAKDALTD